MESIGQANANRKRRRSLLIWQMFGLAFLIRNCCWWRVVFTRRNICWKKKYLLDKYWKITRMLVKRNLDQNWFRTLLITFVHFNTTRCSNKIVKSNGSSTRCFVWLSSVLSRKTINIMHKISIYQTARIGDLSMKNPAALCFDEQTSVIPSWRGSTTKWQTVSKDNEKIRNPSLAWQVPNELYGRQIV